jgi:hypothetical protein
MEKQQAGKLTEIALPGLAIRQARFLALSELRSERGEQRMLKVVAADRDLGQDAERARVFNRLLDAFRR